MPIVLKRSKRWKKTWNICSISYLFSFDDSDRLHVFIEFALWTRRRAFSPDVSYLFTANYHLHLSKYWVDMCVCAAENDVRPLLFIENQRAFIRISFINRPLGGHTVLKRPLSDWAGENLNFSETEPNRHVVPRRVKIFTRNFVKS